ncbi:MAG: beta-lactamase family protein [Planctomycetes bacterium]|nr:beta-lactamase family protein [Planctomycetota bacterium]
MTTRQFTALALLTMAALPAQDHADAIDRACRAIADEHGHGLAVLVAHDGKVLHRAGYGRSDPSNDKPLRPEQPFYVASVAKGLTAACVLHLAQAKKLDLDADVRTLLSELRAQPVAFTARQMLQHRSGLRDFYELFWLAGKDLATLTSDDVLAMLTRQRQLDFAPGSAFAYSNSGYLLLGELVARKSGSSLRAYADEHLFAPLGMRHTSYRDAKHPDIAELPLAGDDGKPTLAPPMLCGAGGLFATVDDLHRWLLALRTGTWQPDLIAALTTPSPRQLDQRRSPTLEPYENGMLLADFDGHPARQLRGGFGGWQAIALSLPTAKLEVVALSAGDHDVLGLARTIVRTLIGEPKAIVSAPLPKPGFTIFRSDDGELAFFVVRGNGTAVLTTLGYKVQVASRDDALVGIDTGVPVLATRVDDDTLRIRIGDAPERTYRRVAMAKASADAADELAGKWHADELDADLTFTAAAGQLRLEEAARVMPLVPFRALDRDTWVSDTGMQIDVIRRGDGAIEQLRISTARARNIRLTRR